MEMVVVAAATPPMLTSKDCSPGGTSGIKTFICIRPTKPGAIPANCMIAQATSNFDLHNGDGHGKGTRRSHIAGRNRRIDQALAGKIGRHILPGPRRSLRCIECSIGQVERENDACCPGVKTPGPAAATSKFTAGLGTPLDVTTNFAVPTLVS